jgi:hypothetical protein
VEEQRVILPYRNTVIKMTARERWVIHAERYVGEIYVVYPVNGDSYPCKEQSVGKYREQGIQEPLNENDPALKWLSCQVALCYGAVEAR